eukprot:NODE_74_length_23402_cov_1.166974.p12 type:complete len:102 gc:universal NODE_74_length_23402_cov_1.166974:14539-14844(+)
MFIKQSFSSSSHRILNCDCQLQHCAFVAFSIISLLTTSLACTSNVQMVITRVLSFLLKVPCISVIRLVSCTHCFLYKSFIAISFPSSILINAMFTSEVQKS